MVARSISSSGKLADGCVLLELPLKEGQTQKALELMMEHPHGIKYTMAQPGFISYSIGLDGNLLVLNGYWERKEQWLAYAGSREVKEGVLGEKNAQWDEAFGPFIDTDGELRAAPMDIIKTYYGSAKDVTEFSGMPRVEFPIKEGKLDEAVQILMKHPHGMDFLLTMPGIKEVYLAKDTEKNSIIIMGKILKLDHWNEYLSKRQSDEGELGELNASWKEAFFPFVAEKPSTASLELSNYVDQHTSGTVETDDGASIYFETHGTGDKAIVFCNGWGTLIRHWKPQVDFFSSSGYTCIMVDLRNYERSKGPEDASTKGFSRERHAADVAHVLAHLDIKKANIIGHATGVTQVLAFVKDFPFMCDKVVLIDAGINTPFPSDSPFMLQVAGALSVPDEVEATNNVYNMYRSFFTPDTEVTDDGMSKVIDSICHDASKLDKKMLLEDLAGRWGPGTQNLCEGIINPPPTLLLASNFLYSGAVLTIPDKKMHSNFEIGKMMEIKRVDSSAHFVHVEKSEECNKIIGEWLASNSG